LIAASASEKLSLALIVVIAGAGLESSMSDVMLGNRLDRLVDQGRPHPGPANAAIALVEYGSYACPYCRAANERIAKCAISSATGCAISSFIGLSSASSSLLRRRTGGADRGPQKFL
jgi:hypothetical protein